MTGELGHGGMAVVYRARDTQLLRDVAIKVLHPHLAGDPESRRRFLREAQAAARLRHPNIVEVFDFSGEADRESFMVTELLEGPTLRRFAEQHPGMPAEVVAAAGIVICDALACAHGQGVIHRDVKPDNILLQKGGLLKLTDFGIAHVADSGSMTVTGQVLGSPAHMAPEQIEGRAVDPRADLFAMGTVLYALAVGRLPFEAPHPHALLRKILEADYPDPLRVAPTIGHRFAGIIRRCLEREPDKRYADAGELRRALAEFVAELGWDAPDAQLKKYLAGPDAFGASHRAQLLERLPALGAKARREGNLPDALGYFNRALALDPTNAKVLAMVTGISRRRKIRRALSAAAIVGVAASLSAAGVVAIARQVRSGPRPRAGIGSIAARAPEIAPESHAPAPHAPEHAVVPGPQAPEPPRTTGEAPRVELSQRDPRAVASAPRGTGPTASNAPRTTPRSGVPTATSVGNGAHGGESGAAPVPAGNEMRMVLVVPSPAGVLISIDRQPPREYDGRPVALRVGTHSFRLVPTDSGCRDHTWDREIQPGEGTQTLPLHLPECTAGPSPRPHADARDAVLAPR